MDIKGRRSNLSLISINFHLSQLPSCDYSSFKKWFDEGLPTTPTSDSYYNTILTFTILPCIQFKNKQVRKRRYCHMCYMV